MRKKVVSCVLACLGLCISLGASVGGGCCYQPQQECWDSGCCGSIEVFGYALWLQPEGCNRKFVIDDPTYFERFDAPSRDSLPVEPFGTAQGMCPDYDWGFRVGAGYVTSGGCFDVRVYYTRFSTTDCQIFELGNCGVLWPERVPAIQMQWGVPFLDGQGPVLTNPTNAGTADELGTPALVRAKQRFEWDAVDAEVAARLVKCCDFFIRPHVGLEWTEICRKSEFNYQGTTLSTENMQNNGVSAFEDVNVFARSWGVGPRVGVDARYNLFCGFGITGRLGAAVLAGETRARSRALTRIVTKTVETGLGEQIAETTDESPFDVIWPANCVVFPELDVALGLSYEWCCGSCFSLIGEIGYEFRSYMHVLTAEFFPNATTAAAASVCDPFNVHGLYFGLMVQF